MCAVPAITSDARIEAPHPLTLSSPPSPLPSPLRLRGGATRSGRAGVTNTDAILLLQRVSGLADCAWLNSPSTRKRIMFCFADLCTTSINDSVHCYNMCLFLFNVLFNDVNLFDSFVLKSSGLSSSILHVALNMIKRAIIQEEKVSARCVDMYRLSTLITLPLMFLENSSVFRKHASLLKTFSLSLLLDDTEMMSIYVILSADTRHSYIGLVGRNGPRFASKRLSEHVRGGRNNKASNTHDTYACAKLYHTMHNMGAHKFCFVPCMFNVTSATELNMLETKWIRKLVPSMNTQKLPKHNRDHRSRPLPHMRRTQPPAVIPMEDRVIPIIPTFRAQVWSDTNRNKMVPITRTWTTSTSTNVFKRIVSQTTSDVHSNLFDVFMRLWTKGHRKQVVLQQFEGNIHLTNMTKLVQTFGRTTIEVRRINTPHMLGQRYTLKEFLRVSRQYNVTEYTVCIVKIVKNSPRNSPHYRMLVNAARHPLSKDRESILNNVGPTDLLKMWTMLPHIQCGTTREHAADLVTRGLRRQGMNVRPESVITIPHRDDIVYSKVRFLPDLLIDKMDLIPEMKSAMKGEVRVTPTRRLNMRDHLINYRRLAKNPTVATAPAVCTCQKIKKILGLDDETFAKNLIDGHLAIRAPDLPDGVDPLLKGNLNNIPATDLGCFRNELLHSVDEWMRKFIPIVNDDSRKQFPITFHGKYVHITDPGNKSTVPIAKIAFARFARWHYEYRLVSTTNKDLFEQCHGTNFVDDVIRMVKIHTKSINRDHWVNHPPVYQKLSSVFGTKAEYFASPLNFNLCHRAYFSEHTIDCLFGSKGNAWTHRWHASGVANPVFSIPDMRRTFEYAKTYAKKFTGNSYVVTIPLWEGWSEQYMNLLNDNFVHPLFVFDENQYSFHSPWAMARQMLLQKVPEKSAPWPVALFLVREQPPTPTEITQLDSIRTYFRENAMPAIPADEMDAFINKIHDLQGSDEDAICTEDCESTHLKHWNLNTAPIELYDKSGVRVDMTCTRYGLDLDTILDEAVSKCVKTTQHKTERITPERLKSLMTLVKSLQKFAAVYEIDKNSACALFSCHCYHQAGLNKTFVNDPHYSKVTLTSDEITRQWKSTFVYKKWSAMGAFEGKSLPYAYDMPKNKDLAKRRPIVSYCVHPMRNLLQRASRALRCALARSGAKHYNLDRTDQFVPELRAIVSKLKSQGYDRVVAQAGDIKDMYTELPHDFILEAVDWLLALVGSKTRRKDIAAPRRGRKGTFVGRSSNTDAFVNFSLSDLRDIVEFDLDNAIFTVGDVILKQNVGIPMGSPISPVLATLVCSYSESMSISQRKHAGERRVYGKRYVDDAFYICGYNSVKRDDELRARVAIEAVTMRGGCYHNNSVLEMDPNVTRIEMLESIIDLSNPGELEAAFWHKNADFLRLYGCQKFIKFQAFSSFSPYSAKRGVIISTLMRMRAAASSQKGVTDAFPLWFMELQSLGYPKSLVMSALERLHSRGLHSATRDTYWEGVIATAGDVW